MPGFALFFGDHLARSVRGVPGAPPASVIPAQAGIQAIA
jgi:hypothetical protein